MGLRYAPYVFTEQSIAMLSSVLNNAKAIQVNIQIIRIFTRMRQLLTDNNTKNIEVVFRCIDELVDKKEPTRSWKQIGYKLPKQ